MARPTTTSAHATRGLAVEGKKREGKDGGRFRAYAVLGTVSQLAGAVRGVLGVGGDSHE